jgi:phosphoglycolate phosphatase-like HAD superfamily hydrolase
MGDTEYDRTACESIGIDFIGVSWGFGYKSGRTDIFVLDHPKDFLKIVEDRII